MPYAVARSTSYFRWSIHKLSQTCVYSEAAALVHYTMISCVDGFGAIRCANRSTAETNNLTKHYYLTGYLV